MIHVIFGQFSCTNDLRMLQNPRNASFLAPIGFGILLGRITAFKQLRLDSKFQPYPFEMALKNFPILLGTYRIREKNSQDPKYYDFLSVLCNILMLKCLFNFSPKILKLFSRPLKDY